MFDVDAKKKRHDEVFPRDMEKALMLGKEMVKEPWKGQAQE